MADAQKKEADVGTSEEQYSIPHVHKLQYPIEWGKTTKEIISEISFNRRLQVMDLKGLPANELQVTDMIRLIARWSGKSTVLVEMLDAVDYIELVGVVQYFLNGGQTSGEQ